MSCAPGGPSASPRLSRIRCRPATWSFATRAAAAKREPALDAGDGSVVTELIPTIPEAVGFRPPGELTRLHGSLDEDQGSKPDGG